MRPHEGVFTYACSSRRGSVPLATELRGSQEGAVGAPGGVTISYAALAHSTGLPPPPAPTVCGVDRAGGGGALEGKGPQRRAPEAVRQAVGGGCQSGWGRLLSVTNAIQAGTWRQGDSDWAYPGRPASAGGGCLPRLQCIPGGGGGVQEKVCGRLLWSMHTSSMELTD